LSATAGAEEIAMLRISPILRAGCGLLFLAHVAPVGARVLTLTKQGDTTAIIQDASNGDTAANALASPQDRLFVETLAADADHDLVYAAILPDPAGASAGSPHALLVGAYGHAPVPAGSMTAPAGLYFSALAFDPPTSSVVGLVSDPTGVGSSQVFAVPTNDGTAFGVPAYMASAPGCCSITRGVAAWRTSTRELFAVGRRTGDSEDQLLRFDVGTGTALPDAYPIADDRVVALAVDAQDGTLYALARSILDFTYLTRITYSTPGTPVTLSAIGSAPATCCYVAAGPATIDGAGSARALYALTRDAATPAGMQLSRFDFTSGNPQVVNASMEGYGLWTDAAASLDRIFADGFD
jgi:hypothetical protein